MGSRYMYNVGWKYFSRNYEIVEGWFIYFSLYMYMYILIDFRMEDYLVFIYNNL